MRKRVVFLELGTACREAFVERRAEGPDGRRVMPERQPGSAVLEAGGQVGHSGRTCVPR